jgi:uncharacterized pyridoxal phosphate-containing UPF0001 family protein
MSGPLQRPARPTLARTACKKGYRKSKDRPTLRSDGTLSGRCSQTRPAKLRKLLQQIEAAAAEAQVRPDVLVQVDLAGEVTKRGIPPPGAMDIVRAGSRCRSARVVGLMTIPPYFDDPEQVRPYFARLRDLRDSLLKEGLEPGFLRELSMGMSHDFEIAVQEGATIVRLGTAIFGTRHV